MKYIFYMFYVNFLIFSELKFAMFHTWKYFKLSIWWISWFILFRNACCRMWKMWTLSTSSVWRVYMLPVLYPAHGVGTVSRLCFGACWKMDVSMKGNDPTYLYPYNLKSFISIFIRCTIHIKTVKLRNTIRANYFFISFI